MKLKFNLLALALVSGIACAESGGIGTIRIEPNPAKVGQDVAITINADGETPTFCGLGVQYGDGNDENIKIDGRKNRLPLTLHRTFARPGTYTVKVEGKKVTTHFPCLGSASANLLVIEDTATAAAVVCPEGYKLRGKPSKSGAFTCKAGKGAKAPEKVMNCGDDLEYFQTKATLGCRKAK